MVISRIGVLQFLPINGFKHSSPLIVKNLSMARTSHLVLAIQGDPNLGLPFKGSQEITNGSPGSPKSLPSVGPGDFKGF